MNCVFCGGVAPAVKITKEHVIPAWLLEVIKSFQDVGPDWDVTIESGGLAVRDTRFTARRPDVTVRDVCKPCNEGWMSALEVKMKALITDLVLGERVSLSQAQQVDLALWSVKTDMTMALVFGDGQPYRPEDRSLVRLGVPPPHVRVRLAVRQPVGNELVRAKRFSGSTQLDETSPDRPLDAFSNSLAVGHLISNVWGQQTEELTLGRAFGRHVVNAVMISPPSELSATWPPVDVVTDDDLDGFTREPLPNHEDSAALNEWLTRSEAGSDAGDGTS
jgi:hypothetical protein